MLKPWMVPLLLVGAALGSCGGSGGGGSGSAPPPLVYTGNTSPASISASTAPGLASNLIDTLLLAAGVGGDVLDDTATNGSIDEEIAGSEGGKVKIRGEITNGRGTLTFTYTSYQESGILLNGREVVDVLEQQQHASGLYNSRVRQTYTAFTVTSVGSTDSYALDGSISTVQAPASPTSLRFNTSMSGDLVITENPGNRQARISAMSLTRTYRESQRVGESEWLLAGGARIYDSLAGYVDVTMDSPLTLRESESLAGPFYDGSARVAGSNGVQFWISPLTRDYVALELDANSDGAPDRSLSFRWDNDFRGPAFGRSGPLAITGPDLWELAATGPGPHKLESRFSENSAGAFLSHHWTLTMAPAGSTATITGPDTPRATFLPDQNGMYLFRLEVSDGTHTSTDYMTLRAHGYAGAELSQASGSNVAVSSDRRTARVVLEPDIIATDGTVVTLDGRRSYTPDGTPVQSSHWNVGAYVLGSGYSTMLNVVQDPVQVTAAGRLGAGFTTMRQFSGDFPSAANTVVIAPTNRLMAPVVELAISSNTNMRAVADFNADGIDDVVAQWPGTNGSTLRVILGASDGRLRQFGADLTVPNTSGVVVADINGDNRPDILVGDGGGIGYFLQSGVAATPFGSYLTAASGCGSGGGAAGLQVVDADADGDMDVLASATCTARGIVLFRNSGGVLAAGIAVDLPGTTLQMDRFVAIDLNNDNRADLISRSQLSFTTFSWLATSTPGSYVAGPAVSQEFLVNSDFSLNGPIVVDLDGNGRRDAVVAGHTAAQVLWQAADGTLSYQAIGPANYSGFGSVIAARDFDGDGKLDLLTTSLWYRQTGNGTFPTWQHYARGTAQQVADINGDGRPDLVDRSFITLQAPFTP